MACGDPGRACGMVYPTSRSESGCSRSAHQYRLLLGKSWRVPQQGLLLLCLAAAFKLRLIPGSCLSYAAARPVPAHAAHSSGPSPGDLTSQLELGSALSPLTCLMSLTGS